MDNIYKDNVLYENIKALTQELIPIISKAKLNAFYPRYVDKYPNLSYSKSGFPSISHYPSIVDISQFLVYDRFKNPSGINLNDYIKFNTVYSHLKSLPQIANYFKAGYKNSDTAEKFRGFLCENLIESLVERYYYLHGDCFNESDFIKIYLPIENYIYADQIWFDISVPILFVKFDIDYFELTDRIIVRRISDETNRGRHKISTYSPAVVDSVYMSATHELVLKDYYYKKPENWFSEPFSNPQIYPHPIIEKFFAILKIATGYDSGYAQLIIHPHDWADSYYSDILPLKGTTIRKYPDFFENYYWNNEDFEQVSIEQMEVIKVLFSKIIELNENKIEIAIKRFYRSTMRQDEEDVILDLIIALEILLGDNEKTEITHKLALRVAVLLCNYNKKLYPDPMVTFQNVKNIYAYRSNIVHGSHKVSNKREIKLGDNRSVPTVELAKEYLSELLKIMILKPRHLDPKENDKLLLMGQYYYMSND